MANWLTRDTYCNGDYEIWNKKPHKKGNCWYGRTKANEGYVTDFCPEIFNRLTTKASHLKLGEIRKIKSIHFEFAE